MKNIRNIIVLATTIFFIGCGDGGASFDGETPKVQNEESPLVIGEEIAVQSGDTIVPKDDSTEIRINHVLGDTIKHVTLLSGSATLIKGSYEITN